MLKLLPPPPPPTPQLFVMNASVFFYAVCILQCFICTGTHFLISSLFDLTSQTDSVRSRSQSGYPNRKVHTLFFLRLTSCHSTREAEVHPSCVQCLFISNHSFYCIKHTSSSQEEWKLVNILR